MKLYGKELDDELVLRRKAKEDRITNKMTLRNAAKHNNIGLSLSEYCEWERGSDVCPHEKWEKSIGGVHPPFLLLERCVKCGKINILTKIENEKEWEENKNSIEEAFENIKRRNNEGNESK